MTAIESLFFGCKESYCDIYFLNNHFNSISFEEAFLKWLSDWVLIPKNSLGVSNGEQKWHHHTRLSHHSFIFIFHPTLTLSSIISRPRNDNGHESPDSGFPATYKMFAPPPPPKSPVCMYLFLRGITQTLTTAHITISLYL